MLDDADFTDEELDRLFGALSDATRRDIVRRTLAGEQSVSALARAYPMSFAAVQKHVAVLARAGLVRKVPHGREQRVHGDADTIARATALLDGLTEIWRSRITLIDHLLQGELP